jgi:hypothetical protein
MPNLFQFFLIQTAVLLPLYYCFNLYFFSGYISVKLYFKTKIVYCFNQLRLSLLIGDRTSSFGLKISFFNFHCQIFTTCFIITYQNKFLLPYLILFLQIRKLYCIVANDIHSAPDLYLYACRRQTSKPVSGKHRMICFFFHVSNNSLFKTNL